MNDNQKEEHQRNIALARFFQQRRRQGISNIIEVVIVFAITNVFLLNGMFDATFSHIIPNYYDGFFRMPVFSKALFITFIHVIFTVVYGVSPLQLIFKKLINPRSILVNKVSSITSSVGGSEGNASAVTGEFGIAAEKSSKYKSDTAEIYLKELIFSSRSLSKNIYNRGSLYLTIGLVCAFAGIAFFYSQTHVVDSSKKPSEQVFFLLPNFGVLFFLELVAFFFLRQYKTVMDEFRYYEAIQRSREETLVVIKFTLESGKEIDFADMIDKVRSGTNPAKLEAGQSTEFLESRKLDKSELDTLTKLVETVVSKLGQGNK